MFISPPLTKSPLQPYLYSQESTSTSFLSPITYGGNYSTFSLSLNPLDSGFLPLSSYDYMGFSKTSPMAFCQTQWPLLSTHSILLDYSAVLEIINYSVI